MTWRWALGDVLERGAAAAVRGSATPVTESRAAVRLVTALLKFTVSAIFVAVLLNNVSLRQIAPQVGQARIWPLFLGVILLFAQFPLSGFRWRAVLNACGADASPWRLQNLTWAGQFINQAMPTFLIGDAVRAWYLVQTGVSRRAAVNSLLLDRVIGLLGLLMLIVMVAPAALPRLGSGPAWSILVMAATGMTGIMGGFVGCRWLRHLPIVARWEWIAQLVHAVCGIGTSPARFLSILLLAVGTNALASLAAWFLALGLHIGLSPLETLIAMPVGLLAMLLPVSIAGWGVREGALVSVLVLLGVPAPQGLLLSFAFGIAMLLAALPGGGIWLCLRNEASPQ